MLMMPYHLPYQGKLVEACGFAKAKDLLSYTVDKATYHAVGSNRMLDRARSDGRIRLRSLDMKNYKPDLAAFFFSSSRRHTSFDCDWSSDVCSSDLGSDDRLLPAGEVLVEAVDVDCLHRRRALPGDHEDGLLDPFGLVGRVDGEHGLEEGVLVGDRKSVV